MSKVTIVMYHYVRPSKDEDYPTLNALDVDDFYKQIKHLQQFYEFVTVEDCMCEIYSPTGNFPQNAVLLTFDDGYIDHYTTVFPVLESLEIQGVFSPVISAVEENELLNVNKIHFLLAEIPVNTLLKETFRLLDIYKKPYQLKPKEDYTEELLNKIGSDRAKHLDPKEVIFIKRLFQRELPVVPREEMIDDLFTKFITKDEEGFAEELYMDTGMLTEMVDNGMFVAGHGYFHTWWNTLKKETIKKEIFNIRDFLERIGMSRDDWVMCYPYGAYNQQVIELLGERNCKMAFSSESGIAQLKRENALKLKRIDTVNLLAS